MNMKLLLISAVLLVVLAAHSGSASQIGGQGFATSYPAQKGAVTPHLKTPQDTRLVAPKGPREAQLVCLQKAPVRRLVLCDIVTWDVCGNTDGEDGNQTDWRATVRHVNTNKYSRLVSPIIWLEQGVARFHWTPTSVGVHEVRVWRHENSLMDPLLTPAVMTYLVIIHDTVAKCSPTHASGLQSQLQRIMWAQASFTNERKGIPFLEELKSKPTTVVRDLTPFAYNKGDAVLQQHLRRPTVVPAGVLTLGTFAEVQQEYDYCELIKATTNI